MEALKMYAELAKWWPLLSAVEDYAEEVPFFLDALRDSGIPLQGTMLELGSGGGNNAFHLKQHFAITLVDLAPGMLDVSRTINPDCDHHVGDMRTFRISKQFDTVFIHDAIDYMTSEADLRQALETAFIQCKPGGAALFVPDYVREIFEPSTDHGGHDGEGRGLRYLEWTYDPDTSDTFYTTHYAFMLREGDTVHVEHETHICGLFPRATWLHLLTEIGFQPKQLTDNFDREIFVALKPR